MTRKAKLVNGKVVFEEIPGTTLEETFEDRFKRALSNTRKRQVRVKQNVRECCRSCVTEAKLGLPEGASDTIPHVWTYGGQGSAYRWIDGEPHFYSSASGWRYSGDETRVKRIYFNHGGPGTEGARALVEEMRAQGITVEWDGSEYKCPEIITPYGLEKMQSEAVLQNS